MLTEGAVGSIVTPVGRAAEIDLVLGEVIAHGQMLVTGEAGIGKSTLLDDAVRRLHGAGFVVVSAAGSPGLVDHPLAALGHLIGDAGDRSGPALTEFGVSRLRDLARGDGAVVVVDDAHVLDAMSLYVLARARADGGPRVLMASRGGPDLRSTVAQFGRFPGVTLEMQRLSARETAELAESVLGAPLDTPSAERIHSATDGLPLAIDELLRSAIRRGSIVLRAGLHRWDSTAPADRHLAALLGLRVDELGGSERDVIDALAIAGDLPIEVTSELSRGVGLSAMEAQRLIRAAPRPGWIRIGHPLLRDAAVGLLGPIRRRELAGRVVALLDGADSEVVRLRVVLAVDADVGVPLDDLVRVAAWGRSHALWRPMLPVMERAWLEAPSAHTGLAFGEALYWTRQMERAEHVFRSAEGLCSNEAEHVALATARARTLEIGLGRSAEAAALRADELVNTGDPAQRLELQCAEAERDLFDGRVTRILAIREEVAAHWDAADMTTTMGAARYRLTQSTVGALGLVGQIGPMLDEFRLHTALALHHAGTHPTVREVVDPWWVAGHLLSGDRATAAELMETHYADSLMIDDGLSRPLWALPKAIDRWLAGDLIAAEHFAREAMGVPETVVSIRRMATHFLARILDLAGRPDESVEHARATAGDDYVGIVREWSVGLENRGLAVQRPFVSPSDLRTSTQRVLQAIANLRADGQLVAAAWVSHDLVRAGEAAAVSTGLEELAAQTDAPAVRWMSEHAAALVSHDGPRLTACAGEARRAGCHAMAVLLAQDAVETTTAQRDVTGALVASQLAAEARSHTSGMSPVDIGPDIAARFGLSRREAEVARAASGGLTDQQISDELFISVRTVNAHLRAVYRKLGVAGRHELVLD